LSYQVFLADGVDRAQTQTSAVPTTVESNDANPSNFIISRFNHSAAWIESLQDSLMASMAGSSSSGNHKRFKRDSTIL
jgi:hypothetical protein